MYISSSRFVRMYHHTCTHAARYTHAAVLPCTHSVLSMPFQWVQSYTDFTYFICHSMPMICLCGKWAYFPHSKVLCGKWAIFPHSKVPCGKWAIFPHSKSHVENGPFFHIQKFHVENGPFFHIQKFPVENGPFFHIQKFNVENGPFFHIWIFARFWSLASRNNTILDCENWGISSSELGLRNFLLRTLGAEFCASHLGPKLLSPHFGCGVSRSTFLCKFIFCAFCAILSVILKRIFVCSALWVRKIVVKVFFYCSNFLFAIDFCFCVFSFLNGSTRLFYRGLFLYPPVGRTVCL